MKYLFALLLAVLSFSYCFSQEETEPNNSFETANTVISGDITTASLGSTDNDYFKAEFEYNASFYLVVEATNTSASGSHLLQFSLYDGLTFVGVGLQPNLLQTRLINSSPIAAGETVYDTIEVCGLAPDNYYMLFSGNGSFDYHFQWFPANAAVIDGGNNTRATARPFFFNVKKEGSLNYEFWGNQNLDSANYFTSVLPAGDYSSRRLYLDAQHNGCFSSAAISYSCYRNNATTPFATGFIGNNSSVAPHGRVNNSLSLSNMAAGDSLFVKFTANGPFGYNFIYKDPGGFDDAEDNCCVHNAILLEENIPTGGNVGGYDFGNNAFLDEFDTYRFTMPHYGAVTVEVTAANADCGGETYSFQYDLLDEFGNEINTRNEIIYWDNYPACNTQQSATFKIRGLSTGVYHLRLRSGFEILDARTGDPGSINYTIKYNITDSTTRFDAEPNGTTATAIPLAPGEIKKGNVLFWPFLNRDANDYYRVEVPADGKLTINLKSVFLGSYETSNNTFEKLQVELIGRLTTIYSPGNTPAILSPDSSYTSTSLVCAVGAGTYYFRVSAGYFTPHEYEISYQFTDTSSLNNDPEPNDTKAQAVLTGGGQTRKGQLYYHYNGATDTDDYYKIVFTVTDSLKLYVNATNTSCTNGRRIRFSGVNKNNTLLFNRYIGNNTSVADGQTITDSVKIKITAPDTIYVRFFDDVNLGAFKYEMTTGPLRPSSVFTLQGDTAVCVSTQEYKAINVPENNVTYNWSLPDGGGTLTFADSVATVNWTSTGSRRVQLFLSNSVGVSQTKQINVVVNGFPPTQVPVAYNFARTLSTNSLPPGAACQWYKNDVLIPGATDSVYYAADAGSFTVKFKNDCGGGPASNAISFPAAAQAQTISFPHTPNTVMTLNGKIVLPATASSGLPVFYRKLQGFGLLQNDTFYFVGNSVPGAIIFMATQPGDDVYAAAPPKYDTITILKGNQAITFDSIPPQVLSSGTLTLTASSSMGLTISYQVVSGTALASVNENRLTLHGAGTVTLRAMQDGNANYNAATPIERSFCIGVRTLAPITGDANPCLNTYRYTAQKIPGAQFVWTLSGGGIMTTHNDTAWVQWQTPGAYTLNVKANSPCDTVFTNEQELNITTSNNLPGVVTNMLPENNATDQLLPLKLSWIPGSNTVNYDLYVWDSAVAEPVTPFAANISGVSYTVLNNALQNNKTYKWRVVAKNPCAQTPGPVQKFKIIPLPDLLVSNVQVPATANSGQTITISWKVTNIGPGRTAITPVWQDGVFFSLDTTPNFRFSPNWDPYTWNALVANDRPLLLGAPNNITALDSGQFYTNSLNFTLPQEYNFPVYVYVIAGYNNPNYPIKQASVLNDTARAPQPISITLSPTPDLRVDSVFAPASTFSGSTINLTYKVKNYGVVTPPGSAWTDSVFISQNPLFDRNQCIPLKAAKANGSYYPAGSASAANNTQLTANGVYTKNMQVVIPNNIFGTWFIYVKTNAGILTNNSVYEGALNGNNVNQSQLQVYLTPTPKLTVNTLTVPVTTASVTQPIGINWTILNQGFTDNIEKNKGHYFLRPIGLCSCSPSVACNNCVCVPPKYYFDSTVQGSSYWVDRVYISTDSTGLNLNNAVLLNEVAHGDPNSGLIVPDENAFFPCNYLFYGPINLEHVLKAGSSFPKSLGFTIPSNLTPGNYYVYVYTNATKTVFEYPGTPQIKRSTLPITVQRPDVVVSSITAPANATGAQAITVNYSVLNNGPGAVFNHVRKDRIYVSAFPSFEGSAQLIATKNYTESLPAGVPVAHSVDYTFPAATSGTRYFYVITNYDSAFRETNANNNTSAAAAVSVSATVPADLVVSNLQFADTTFTIVQGTLTYTVTNNGTGTASGAWRDTAYFSCNAAFNGNAIILAQKIQSRILPPGSSYTDTMNFTIPKMSYEMNSCFPEAAVATAYFYMRTNAGLSVYEGSNTGNNITGTGAKKLANPLVDHVLTTVTAPDTATVGRPYLVNWTVRNTGYKPPYYYYSSYIDAVYFSADSVFNANATLANNYLKYTLINSNSSLNDSRAVIVPYMPTGNYYVFAYTNATDGITGEINLGNNINLVRNASGAAKKIHVVQPLLPDLKDSIVSAPATVAVGQPITLVYRVTNAGTGITYPNTFQNELALSSDFILDNNGADRLLSTRTRNSPLLPAQSYNDTVTVTIPIFTAVGNYVLIAKTNSSNIVTESNPGNNYAYSLLNVYRPADADLVISSIQKPDTVYLGNTIDTVKWTVRNASPNEARGRWSDGVYLSKGNILDSTAVLAGLLNRTAGIIIPALDSSVAKLAPLVNNLTEGSYNLFVKTDLLNNIPESDKANNSLMAATPVYVKVKELKLNITETNTLFKTDRYYKLRIPDSLRGATIRITLKTGDSLTMRNELYIGGSYVPSAAHFDYRFDTPNYGNQQIVITSVADSVYYIDARCVSLNPVTQNITLKAEVLPFAILNVQTNTGGNTGNVTVKISGSLFRDSMVAKLSNAGSTIYASAVYFTNSTTVYATFNLQGRLLGVYDVTLIKPDLSTALLPNGFTIVNTNNGGLITGGGVNTGAGNGNEPGCDPGAGSGLNAQLVVQLVVPTKALPSQTVIIQINYNNPTNVDIPAQSRILYSEEEMKMAFTKEGIPAGATSLYLELTEPGGPPGIIRAGGSGSILVYTKSPPRVPLDPIVTFKLK